MKDGLTNRSPKMSRFFLPVLIMALLLFIPLFVIQSIAFLDFWWWMSLNLIVLVALALATDKIFQTELSDDLASGIVKKVIAGGISAFVLYGLFYGGDLLVRTILDFAGRDIEQVYGFKGDAGAWRIGMLMILVIGPGEELLWRGYVQGNLTRKFGKIKGFVFAALIYTVIHVATGNLILILAALTGGLLWGWMYMKYQSVLMNSISHVLWDISVFLLFPFSG